MSTAKTDRSSRVCCFSCASSNACSSGVRTPFSSKNSSSSWLSTGIWFRKLLVCHRQAASLPEAVSGGPRWCSRRPVDVALARVAARRQLPCLYKF